MKMITLILTLTQLSYFGSAFIISVPLSSASTAFHRHNASPPQVCVLSSVVKDLPNTIYEIDSHDDVLNSVSSVIESSSRLLLSDETTEIQGLSPTANTIIFIIGIIPFVWATYEFWSRIAVGSSFGTTSDSVTIPKPSFMIGEDDNPSKSRGRQTLGQDALIVAYVLFALAIGSVGIAVFSVISSGVPPMDVVSTGVDASFFL